MEKTRHNLNDEVPMDTSSDEIFEEEEEKLSNPRPLLTEKANDGPSPLQKEAAVGKTGGKTSTDSFWSSSYSNLVASNQKKPGRAPVKGWRAAPEGRDVSSPEEPSSDSKRAAKIAERLSVSSIDTDELVSRGSGRKANDTLIKITTFSHSPKKGGTKGETLWARVIDPPLESRGSSSMPSRCTSASPKSVGPSTSVPVVHKPTCSKHKRPSQKDAQVTVDKAHVDVFFKIYDISLEIAESVHYIQLMATEIQRLVFDAFGSRLERAPDDATSTESDSTTSPCKTQHSCLSEGPEMEIPKASETTRNPEVVSEEHETDIPKTLGTGSENVPNPEVVSEHETDLPKTLGTVSENVPNPEVVSEEHETDIPKTLGTVSENVPNPEVASEEHETNIPKILGTVSETVQNPEVPCDDEKEIPKTRDTASETVANPIVSSDDLESDRPGTPEETANKNDDSQNEL